MATITVDNFTDTPVSGETDLRQAIAKADSGDTIVLIPPDASGDVIDMNAPLEISDKTLTIEGNGQVRVDLDSFDRTTDTVTLSALKVDAGASLTLVDVALSGVASNVAAVPGQSGALGTDNDEGGPGGDGGNADDTAGAGGSPLTVSLIDNFGTLDLIQSQVADGSATGGDGGGGGTGGEGGEGDPGGHGGNGGLGGNGGSAIGGVLNESGATLRLEDASISDNGGAGGAGGHGGDGGQGGEGNPRGNGGDGGNGGNGGDGGTGIGGIENHGTIDAVGAAIVAANNGDGGEAGEKGDAGEGGKGGMPGDEEGTHGNDGKAGTTGESVDNVLGAVNGTLLKSGHLYDFDRAAVPASVVTLDPKATDPLTLTYQVDSLGDTATDGSVGWKVVSGKTGPSASDFGGKALPSGTLSFFGGSDAPHHATITLHLSPDAAAPARETFEVVLFDPATGDVIGADGTISQEVDTPALEGPVANPDTNQVVEYHKVSGNVITGDPSASGADDAPAGEHLTVVKVDGKAGGVGTAVASKFGRLILNDDGSYIYAASHAQPLAVGRTVTDHFTYTVQDDDGDTASTTLDIAVTGSAVGTAGADQLLGNAKANTLLGKAGADTLTGLGGNDTLNGGRGADHMIGGAGNDTYVVDNKGDTITETKGGGTDLVESSVSFALGPNVENLMLTGNRAINGTGNSIANDIAGNGAANHLFGGGGADTLDGGAGNDVLTGGGGNDIFRFDAALAAANVATITDFTQGHDKIELDHGMFAALGNGAHLARTEFSDNGVAATRAEHIIYDPSNGFLTYDSNGSGKGGAYHFATLDPGLHLTAADFLVVS